MKEKLIIQKYQLKIDAKGQYLPLKQHFVKHPFLRIALVTDLHDRDPRPLLALLKKSRPDLILLAGDTLERHEEGYDNHTMKEIDSYQEISPLWSLFCNFLKTFHSLLKKLGIDQKENRRYGLYFLKKVSSIAPVYLSRGNHEWYFLPSDLSWMKKHRIHLLDNDDSLFLLNGQEILIGGLPTMYDLDWLKEFSLKNNKYKILLCHHPEYYERFIRKNDLDCGLVLSGHAHGGQWRFFHRGILSPGQGLFPKYHHGLYGNLLVSSGVSNTSFLPRFGNPCELVIIELFKK